MAQNVTLQYVRHTLYALSLEVLLAIFLAAKHKMQMRPGCWFDMQSKVTGASSGAQEDAVKAEAKVQDLQGRLKIAEQEKAAAEKAQKVSLSLMLNSRRPSKLLPSILAVK